MKYNRTLKASDLTAIAPTGQTALNVGLPSFSAWENLDFILMVLGGKIDNGGMAAVELNYRQVMSLIETDVHHCVHKKIIDGMNWDDLAEYAAICGMLRPWYDPILDVPVGDDNEFVIPVLIPFHDNNLTNPSDVSIPVKEITEISHSVGNLAALSQDLEFKALRISTYFCGYHDTRLRQRYAEVRKVFKKRLTESMNKIFDGILQYCWVNVAPKEESGMGAYGDFNEIKMAGLDRLGVDLSARELNVTTNTLFDTLQRLRGIVNENTPFPGGPARLIESYLENDIIPVVFANHRHQMMDLPEGELSFSLDAISTEKTDVVFVEVIEDSEEDRKQRSNVVTCGKDIPQEYRLLASNPAAAPAARPGLIPMEGRGKVL